MEHTTTYAEQVEALSFNVRDGWQQENDEASDLLKRAAYLLARGEYRGRVNRVFDELAFTGALTGCGPYEASNVPRYLLADEAVLHFGDYCWSIGMGGALHLTVCCFPEDRATIILALLAAGVVDGFNGSEVEFEEAHSAFGSIAIRTKEKRHPNAVY
jgi:hypothetical protein